MGEKKNYQKNLQLFARFHPYEAFQLEKTKCLTTDFCQTMRGELNLQKDLLALHYPYGAREEMKRLFESLSLTGVKALFVYGIGLGYFYEAAKEWLHGAPDRHLIFLEDDPEVFKRFLESPNATSILKDPSVYIHLFSFPSDYNWSNLNRDFAWLLWAFANKSALVTALPAYFRTRLEFFDKLCIHLYRSLAHSANKLREYTLDQEADFRNFYANLPYLESSQFGPGLYGKFNNMPAIICGGGPSLEKQLSLLNELKNKALIIGSGSALNILTRNGIIPHFGGGVDTTPTQEVRRLASFDFEVPFFYFNRYNHGAFKHIHGPRMFINGGGGELNSVKWFEEKIGVDDPHDLIAGFSSTNFLLETAAFMGCNPIILVGVDLAYTAKQRYAPGLAVHPTANRAEREEMSAIDPYALPVPGVTEEEVYTKWIWIEEAAAITAFKLRNPSIDLINATEGGMPIIHVPNHSLEEVAKNRLKGEFDFASWVHGHIQSASMPKGIHNKILQTMNEWKESLQRCLKHCQKPTALAEAELHEEPAYLFLLQDLETVFNTLHLLETGPLKRKRYNFLKKYIKFHLNSLNQGLESYLKDYAQLSHQKRILTPIIGKSRNAKPLSYSNRTRKLEGDFAFYGSKGQILTESHFSQGKREGVDRYYYRNGQCYCVKPYMAGKEQGAHHYYYPDGIKKSEINYKNGKLDGSVHLYFPNGRLKRELHFSQGRQKGMERMWDASGALIFEHNYV